jgi:hypothetical protein
MEFLISAAEKGGIVMMAHIALNAGKPDPEITHGASAPSATGSSDDHGRGKMVRGK